MPVRHRFYTVVVTMWAALAAALWYTSSVPIEIAFRHSFVVGALFCALIAAISYFWLNGTKDLAYTLFYHLWFHKRVYLPAWRSSDFEPTVVMVYCTRNDFSAESLRACMWQTRRRREGFGEGWSPDTAYHNVKTVILDDSDKPEYLAAVDAFAQEHGLEVVRRSNRKGFKAGNLNNYLRRGGYDYFVILDSDEIIPPDFVDRCLDYFQDPFVGIVQANHRATRNRNAFMQKFSPGVDAHWLTYQAVKSRYGFISLLGHGAMVSRECYMAARGFPHIVAEDIGFSIMARRAGYRTVFAPDVMCEEEFPVDFLAFKKRHTKWTEGNMEFIRKGTKAILTAPMPWFEKLDIVLFTYSLPLTGVFFVFVIINAVFLPAAGYAITYPLWMLIPTVVFLIAPMLNDMIVLGRQMGARRLASYLLMSTLLFGSMYFVSLRASIKSAVGGSVFHVTPKDNSLPSFWDAVRSNWGEYTMAIALGAVVTWAAGSIFPVLLLAAPTAFMLYLTVYNAKKAKR